MCLTDTALKGVTKGQSDVTGLQLLHTYGLHLPEKTILAGLKVSMHSKIFMH